jgi:hypothetical protein
MKLMDLNEIVEFIFAYVLLGLLLIMESFALIRIYLASKAAPK